jgi:betaine-aldehyde dehydrogenase
VQTETKRIRNFIGGEHADPAEGRLYDLVNPSTGEVFAQAPASGKEAVDRAYRAAERAFEGWRDATPPTRQLALFRIADALEERAEEIVRAESENTGKPIGLTMEEEIPMAVDQIRFFAGAPRVLEGKSAGEYLEGHTSFIRREPVGVCGQVTPWNYPMMMAVWKFAPAIAAGNAIRTQALRHHPHLDGDAGRDRLGVPSPRRLERGLRGPRHGPRPRRAPDAPDGVHNRLVRAGMQVAEAAAYDLKRTHLELGGKAPVIVFDDADLEAAAEAIAVAGYFNAGQDCTAATRVLAAPASTTTSSPRSPSRQRARRPAAPTTRTSSTAPEQPDPARARLRHGRAAPGHAEVVTGGQKVDGRAFSTPPPSSRA